MSAGILLFKNQIFKKNEVSQKIIKKTKYTSVVKGDNLSRLVRQSMAYALEWQASG